MTQQTANNNYYKLNETKQHPLTQNQTDQQHNKTSGEHILLTTAHRTADITRPTLKRLTAEQDATVNNKITNHQPTSTSNQIWFTKPLQASPRKAIPDNPVATPLAHNPNRVKGDRDVLIHHVEKSHTLPGIALSYGISLPALRKANGMWPTDPLTIKHTLRIPLGLCNLPPAKKIEIEQDSGKVLVWEQHPPPSTTHSSASEHLPMHHSNTPRQQGSHINLLDYCSSDSSDRPHQKHLSISSCSSSYPHQQQQQPLPYAQLGELAPISNSGSPPPSPLPTVASLEKVPASQLGFFTTSPHQAAQQPPNPQLSTPPRQSFQLERQQVSESLPVPARASTSMVPSPSSISNLRQRSTNQSQQTASSSSSSSYVTPTPLKTSLPIAIPPSSDPRAFTHFDQPQISPDSQKKLTSQIHLFSHSRIPRVSSHHFSGGADEREQQHWIARGRRGGRGSLSSKWTTVRPGRPPPLHRQLKFLEESATLGSNKVGAALSHALDGLFRSPPLPPPPSRPDPLPPPPSSSTLQQPSADSHLHHHHHHHHHDHNQPSPSCNAPLWNIWNHLFVPPSDQLNNDPAPSDPSLQK
ncbi:hypothetical protein PCASD_05610 [Puccinia coronata f. sp. avenae]|uniref:LysM domain-containing protein n=1 Tax=Puccinia coronata f. sp. avenae TaxID=200324 RepID=A0A2N5UWQ3_9BASI|nr:hypothetical protein PCASD_05610 [Puccinia coronata f. sp. avenae]